VFVTVALGLAFPYLLLSWNPAWLKFLPKPGAWMQRFKVAMGFPMLATAVWLFTLTNTHYGKRVWWLGVFLVLVAFSAWFYGEFVQRGRTRRGLSLAIVLLLLGSGFLYAVEKKLRWRDPIAGTVGGDGETIQDEPNGILWRPWSTANVEKFRAEGRTVLVDFTADWCATCNTIVKPALESDAVRAKLKEINAVALLADYTKLPPVMTAELNKYERAGVPLVLVFPKDATRPAIVLPEAFTPGMVVKALDEAVK
jgi:thiol:disulfide interchange protein DsbD